MGRWATRSPEQLKSFILFYFFHVIRSSGATAHTHEKKKNPRKCWTKNSQNGRHFSLISLCLYISFEFLFFPQKINRNDEFTLRKEEEEKRCTGASISSQVVCQKRIASEIYMAALVGGRFIIVNYFYFIFSFLQVLSVFKARQHTHTGITI